jgi:hypothetical protein
MITAGRDHLSANEFREAMLTTPRGGTFVYFTGELGYDLHMAALAKESTRSELGLVIRMAMEGAEAGDLALTQRRLSASNSKGVGAVFEYRATKIRPEFRSTRLAAQSREQKEAA